MHLLVHINAGNAVEAVDGELVVFVEAKSGIKPTRYSTDALDTLEANGWITIGEGKEGPVTVTPQGEYAIALWWRKTQGREINPRMMRPAGRPIEFCTERQRW